MQESLQARSGSRRHGNARRGQRTPEYQAWVGMLARCRPGRPDADRYYDRGVRVCDSWNPEAGGSFENFLADMGPKPGPDFSLDKDSVIPGNLIYGPGRCRWATSSEQMTARRNTHWLSYKGETLSLQQWADRLGVKRSALHRRIKMGWSPEKVIETPIGETSGRFAAGSFITYDGLTLSISEWSRRTGVHKDTLSYRLRNGWSPERALTTPVDPRYRTRK